MDGKNDENSWKTERIAHKSTIKKKELNGQNNRFHKNK